MKIFKINYNNTFYISKTRKLVEDLGSYHREPFTEMLALFEKGIESDYY